MLKEKLYMCFVGLALDRVPSKVLEWAMRKKGIPEVFVISVMSCMSEQWILSCQTRLRLK